MFLLCFKGRYIYCLVVTQINTKCIHKNWKWTNQIINKIIPMFDSTRRRGILLNTSAGCCWGLFNSCKTQMKLSLNKKRNLFHLIIHKSSNQKIWHSQKLVLGYGGCPMPSLNVWFNIQRFYIALNDCRVNMITVVC